MRDANPYAVAFTLFLLVSAWFVSVYLLKKISSKAETILFTIVCWVSLGVGLVGSVVLKVVGLNDQWPRLMNCFLFGPVVARLYSWKVLSTLGGLPPDDAWRKIGRMSSLIILIGGGAMLLLIMYVGAHLTIH